MGDLMRLISHVKCRLPERGGVNKVYLLRLLSGKGFHFVVLESVSFFPYVKSAEVFPFKFYRPTFTYSSEKGFHRVPNVINRAVLWFAI